MDRFAMITISANPKNKIKWIDLRWSPFQQILKIKSYGYICQGWANVLFKRTQRSCFFFAFFSKECNVLAFFAFFMKRTLHSFTFFIKERCVLCVLLRSLKKTQRSFTFFIKENAVFFVFFYVLNKKMRRSLRSFTFFIKECKKTLCSFWFHKSYKNEKSRKKRT